MYGKAIRCAGWSALLFLAGVGAAQAELGGTAASVETDRARMGARIASRALGGYTRMELTRANGGAVHEFANARGQVFAVAWSGPGKPDLRSLLGRHFATLRSAESGDRRLHHSLRRPIAVAQGDLQIQTAGHMGWFRGVAFIPSLAPAGFATADLAQGL